MKNELVVERRAIADLRVDPENARAHDDRNLAAIKKSLEEFGQQKPIEIFARPIRKHTRPTEICFEPFSGSGSQIIACQAERRRCYAIEIEPAFVDVAIKRWQTTTESEATLDGQTFRDVEIERSADAEVRTAEGADEGS